jgi:hypothetical protein
VKCFACCSNKTVIRTMVTQSSRLPTAVAAVVSIEFPYHADPVMEKEV